MDDARFDMRFAALCDEGRARKNEYVEQAMELLKQVDTICERMRAEGLAVRVELGMGAKAKPSDMRFVVEMRASL